MKTYAMRNELLRTARFQCMYCKRPLGGQIFNKEHIIPRASGGADNISNRTASCQRCNLNKSKKVQAVDPYSGLVVPLYNPEEDWEKHFWKPRSVAIGRSLTGRATATLLFKPTPHFVPERTGWAEQWNIGDRETELYLDTLHGYLRAQQFSDFDELLSGIFSCFRPCSPEIRRRVGLALLSLRIDRIYTQAISTRIPVGLRLAEKGMARFCVTPKERASLLRMKAILQLQTATLCALRGDRDSARTMQLAALETHRRSIGLDGSKKLEVQLRTKSLASRFSLSSPLAYGNGDIEEAVGYFERAGNVGPLCLLADLELERLRNSPLAERLLIAVDDVLQRAGYGQRRAVVLRRRWWLLKVKLQQDINDSLLQADLAMWAKVPMDNEIRHLQYALNNFASLGNPLASNVHDLVVRTQQSIRPLGRNRGSRR